MENMPPCCVLRCLNPGFTVRRIMEEGAFVVEVVVCEHHSQDLEAGVPSRYDPDQRCVLMGTDIDTAGRRLITTYAGIERNFMETPSGAILVRFEDENGEPVKFYVAKDMWDDMIVDYIDVYPRLDLDEIRKRRAEKRETEG